MELWLGLRSHSGLCWQILVCALSLCVSAGEVCAQSSSDPIDPNQACAIENLACVRACPGYGGRGSEVTPAYRRCVNDCTEDFEQCRVNAGSPVNPPGGGPQVACSIPGWVECLLSNYFGGGLPGIPGTSPGKLGETYGKEFLKNLLSKFYCGAPIPLGPKFCGGIHSASNHVVSLYECCPDAGGVCMDMANWLLGAPATPELLRQLEIWKGCSGSASGSSGSNSP